MAEPLPCRPDEVLQFWFEAGRRPTGGAKILRLDGADRRTVRADAAGCSPVVKLFAGAKPLRVASPR
jgi:hypothetical protein